MTEKKEEENEWKEWELKKFQEFRFEIDYTSSIFIKLKKGTAEIFGSELAIGIEYEIRGQKAAIFTWQGCVFEIKGKCDVEYIAEETPMMSYLNTHMAIEQLRCKNEKEGIEGPRVMIVGPPDVGKTTLSKILINYAVKHGRTPMFVDINPSEGTVTIPATLTATVMDRPIDIEEQLSILPAKSSMAPLTYFFGYLQSTDKLKLYNKLLIKLATTIQKKMDKDTIVKYSGLIISTPNNLSNNTNWDNFTFIIEKFKVNVIIVVGHERLYSDISKFYQDNEKISVVKLSKSGGVVNRDTSYRRIIQSYKIKEYFYGTHKCELAPYSVIVPFTDIFIRTIEQGIAPSSALPIGMKRKVQETRLVPVEPSEDLVNQIIALTNIDVKDESEEGNEEDDDILIGIRLLGFVHVTNVDMEKKKITLLCPCHGRIPKKYMLLGDLKWIET
jgi:polyribonucleotide 5'-hydroxyl-kinase